MRVVKAPPRKYVCDSCRDTGYLLGWPCECPRGHAVEKPKCKTCGRVFDSIVDFLRSKGHDCRYCRIGQGAGGCA